MGLLSLGRGKPRLRGSLIRLLSSWGCSEEQSYPARGGSRWPFPSSCQLSPVLPSFTRKHPFHQTHLNDVDQQGERKAFSSSSNRHLPANCAPFTDGFHVVFKEELFNGGGERREILQWMHCTWLYTVYVQALPPTPPLGEKGHSFQRPGLARAFCDSV